MMYRIIIIILGLTLASLMACKGKNSYFENKNEEGVIVAKNHLWRTTRTDRRFISSTVEVGKTYNDLFISSIQFGDEIKVSAFDIHTGDKRWEWNDFINDVSFLHIRWPHIHENKLIFQSGNRGYCIDMDTGETVWKKVDEIGSTHSYINGFKDIILKKIGKVFIDGEKYTLDYIFDINGDVIKIVPPQPVSNSMNPANQKIIGTHGSTMFTKRDKDYLTNVSGQVDSIWNVFTYFGLYNLTDDKWEYYGKQLLPPKASRVADGFPIIEDDVVVNSVGHFICANHLWTGDSLWVYECPGNFVFGGFIVHESHVYALSEADALYCFDLYTGDLCWRMFDRGLGTASQMVHLNGVIYFTSGGNGNLMAVDMDTGELLWNIESPESESFNREIAVAPGEDGEKGRILTATYKSVLCYEAIK